MCVINSSSCSTASSPTCRWSISGFVCMRTYIFVYTYMHICIFVHICGWICTCTYIYGYEYVCVSTLCSAASLSTEIYDGKLNVFFPLKTYQYITDERFSPLCSVASVSTWCWSASELAYACTHIVIYICMCIFVYMYICVVEYVYVYVYKCVCVSSSSVCFIASLLTCRWYVSELFIDMYIFIYIFTVYLYSSVCTFIRVYIV